MSEWFVTDDDCLQCCRPIPAIDPQIYELVQINSYPGHVDGKPFYQVSHGRIDVSEYSEEEILDALGAYGYEDMDDFVFQNSPTKEWIYKPDGTLDRVNSPNYIIEYQLIAEMFFELENQEYVENEYDSWNAAVDRVAQLTGLDLKQCYEAEQNQYERDDVKKIKVYDLDAFFMEEHNMQAFRYNKVAIFEGERGVIMAEHEAVHKRVNTITDTVVIPVNPPPEPGHIWICANYEATCSIDELKNAPFTEMTMEEFFDRRKYNLRCEDNFAFLMQNLHEIGFDLHGHFMLEKQFTLDDRIQSANDRRNSSGNSAPDRNQAFGLEH